MSEDGFYYLHENGNLIFKPAIVANDPSYFDSPFVKKVWHVDSTNRLNAWKIVLEGFFYGANVDRLKELANKWALTFEDSVELLKRTRKEERTEAMTGGLPSFVAHVLQMTPDAYWTKVKKDWNKTV